MIFRGEDKVSYRWSWDQLHSTVSKLQQAFRALGIGRGDRISAMMPNMPETIACMLAASSIGAVWPSCSPDFGEQGVLDRFGQIEPKLFVTCDAYWYNGKLQDVSDKVRSVAPKLGCPVMVVGYAGDAEVLAASLADGRTMDAVTSIPSSPSWWNTSRCRSCIRSTSCSRRALLGYRSASCIRPAARCSSISRSIASIAASAMATGCSTSPPAVDAVRKGGSSR